MDSWEFGVDCTRRPSNRVTPLTWSRAPAGEAFRPPIGGMISRPLTVLRDLGGPTLRPKVTLLMAKEGDLLAFPYSRVPVTAKASTYMPLLPEAGLESPGHSIFKVWLPGAREPADHTSF